MTTCSEFTQGHILSNVTQINMGLHFFQLILVPRAITACSCWLFIGSRDHHESVFFRCRHESTWVDMSRHEPHQIVKRIPHFLPIQSYPEPFLSFIFLLKRFIFPSVCVSDFLSQHDQNIGVFAHKTAWDESVWPSLIGDTYLMIMKA